MGCAASTEQGQQQGGGLAPVAPPANNAKPINLADAPVARMFEREYNEVERQYRKEFSDDYLKSIPGSGDPAAPVPTHLVHMFRYLGRDRIIALGSRIYDHIFADQDPEFKWFSDAFRRRPKQLATEHLFWFALQRCGGPSSEGDAGEFTMDRVINFHRSFKMNKKGRDRWLLHGQAALKDADIIAAIGPHHDKISQIMVKWFGDFCDICIERNMLDDMSQ